jgi:hypothetical protein
MNARGYRNPVFRSLLLQAPHKLVLAKRSGLFRDFHCFRAISSNEVTGFGQKYGLRSVCATLEP